MAKKDKKGTERKKKLKTGPKWKTETYNALAHRTKKKKEKSDGQKNKHQRKRMTNKQKT